MNMRTSFVTRARARATFTTVAAVAMLTVWPAAAPAQTVARPAAPPAVQAIPPIVQAPPVVVQVPPVTVVPPVAVQLPDSAALAQLRYSLDSLRPVIADFDLQGMTLDALADFDMASVQAALAQDRERIAVRPQAVRVYGGDATGMYDSGLSAIDNEQWQRAIDRFDRVIQANKTRVDGAMYWKAYAQGKL